jgi:alpha-glucosidase
MLIKPLSPMATWKHLSLAVGLASAAAVSRRQEGNTQYPDYSLLAGCPGYAASNVQTSGNGIKADLKLSGAACNAYGDDLKDLILEVTYESGMFLFVTHIYTVS